MNRLFRDFSVMVVLLMISVSTSTIMAIRTPGKVVVRRSVPLTTAETESCVCHSQGKTEYVPVYVEEETEKTNLFWNNFKKVAGGVIGFCFGCWAGIKIFCC